ncbi:hypothetical protein [Streptomyces longwoodensis]|uniref:hypothetical protein n=1 Tax=Streptomyces longwoodensis TaxID=68231 RepID=UPI00385057B1
MFEGNVAVVLIFVIVLAAACYAIYRFESKPARVVAVIGALAALVGALTPVVRLLVEQPQPNNTKLEAPATPESGSPGATAPGSDTPTIISSGDVSGATPSGLEGQ